MQTYGPGLLHGSQLLYGASDPALEEFTKKNFLDKIMEMPNFKQNQFEAFQSIDFSFFLAGVVHFSQLKLDMRTHCPAFQTEKLLRESQIPMDVHPDENYAVPKDGLTAASHRRNQALKKWLGLPFLVAVSIRQMHAEMGYPPLAILIAVLKEDAWTRDYSEAALYLSWESEGIRHSHGKEIISMGEPDLSFNTRVALEVCDVCDPKDGKWLCLVMTDVFHDTPR